MSRLNSTHIYMSQKVYVPLKLTLLSLLFLKYFQKQCPFYLHIVKQIIPKHPNL